MIISQQENKMEKKSDPQNYSVMVGNNEFLISFSVDDEHGTRGFMKFVNQIQYFIKMENRRSIPLLKDAVFFPALKKNNVYLGIEKIIENGVDMRQIDSDFREGSVYTNTDIKKIAKKFTANDTIFFCITNFTFCFGNTTLFNAKPDFFANEDDKIIDDKYNENSLAYLLSRFEKECENPKVNTVWAYANLSAYELYMMQKLKIFYLPCFFVAEIEENPQKADLYNTTIEINLQYIKERTCQFSNKKVLFLPYNSFYFETFEIKENKLKLLLLDGKRGIPSDQLSLNKDKQFGVGTFRKLNKRTINQKLYEYVMEFINGAPSQKSGNILYKIKPMSKGVGNTKKIFIIEKDPKTIGFSFDKQNWICSHSEDKDKFFKRFRSSKTVKPIFCSHKNCSETHDEQFCLI